MNKNYRIETEDYMKIVLLFIYGYDFNKESHKVISSLLLMSRTTSTKCFPFVLVVHVTYIDPLFIAINPYKTAIPSTTIQFEFHIQIYLSYQFFRRTAPTIDHETSYF